MSTERLSELQKDITYLKNIEAVHGVRLTDIGKEGVAKKIEKMLEEQGKIMGYKSVEEINKEQIEKHPNIDFPDWYDGETS